MTQDASTMLYENTGAGLPVPGDASLMLYENTGAGLPVPGDASSMLYEFTVPNTNPAKRWVWNGAEWIHIPEYTWNGATWVVVT